jgi:hypothetical protein
MVQHAIVLTIAVFTAMLCLLDVRAAAAPSQQLFSLAALLTMAPDLPGISRSVLVSEAERIWRREGVALKWAVPRGDERPSAALRVLVISRREALATQEKGAWTVGELVPHSGQRALAIASIAGAERVVERSGSQFLFLDRPEFTQYQLGVVLGRAVAHEIGHYLLATATHADHGLMRAAIDAKEFADPSAKTFALDDIAGQWLRRRLTQAGETSVPDWTFSYPEDRPADTQP